MFILNGLRNYIKCCLLYIYIYTLVDPIAYLPFILYTYGHLFKDYKSCTLNYSFDDRGSIPKLHIFYKYQIKLTNLKYLLNKIRKCFRWHRKVYIRRLLHLSFRIITSKIIN